MWVGSSSPNIGYHNTQALLASPRIVPSQGWTATCVRTSRRGILHPWPTSWRWTRLCEQELRRLLSFAPPAPRSPCGGRFSRRASPPIVPGSASPPLLSPSFLQGKKGEGEEEAAHTQRGGHRTGESKWLETGGWWGCAALCGLHDVQFKKWS